MKKVVVFLFILLILCVTRIGINSGEVHILKSFNPKQVTFVVSKINFKDVEELKNSENIKLIPSGGDFYITAPIEVAHNIEELLSNYIKGYVYYFSPNESNVLSLMEEKMLPQRIGNAIVYTGYTSKYDNFRIIEGKKVNVQIAITKEKILVGYPLIMTGF